MAFTSGTSRMGSGSLSLLGFVVRSVLLISGFHGAQLFWGLGPWLPANCMCRQSNNMTRLLLLLLLLLFFQQPEYEHCKYSSHQHVTISNINSRSDSKNASLHDYEQLSALSAVPMGFPAWIVCCYALAVLGIIACKSCRIVPSSCSLPRTCTVDLLGP